MRTLQVSKDIIEGGIKIQNWKFNRKQSRKDLAKMIIKHKHSFNMSDHE